MLLDALTQPAANEIPPFPSGYIAKVGDESIASVLIRQRDFVAQLGKLSDEEANKLHTPYTWTIRQVIGHVTDAERVFSYRLMCIARGETKPLPGFDENAYAAVSNANGLPIAKLVEEFLAVRYATEMLLENLPENVATRMGNANGSPISVRAVAYVIAGHAEHHLSIVGKRLGL